jgi:glycosyltransferase involved in cell wall biosynthesis
MRVACISHGAIVPLNRRPYDIVAREMGVDLTLIVPDRWIGDLPDPDLRYTLVPDGAPAVALPARWTGNGALFTLRGLRRTLRSLAPDLVLLDEEPWSLVAWQTLRAADAPLVVYSKQNIAKRLVPPFGWIRQATYRRARSAWAVGVTTQDVLQATGYRGPISLVPHGVEVSCFAPGRDDERRRALGLTGLVIGYAGRLIEEKGIGDLLAAADLLAADASLPPFTLLIAGGGPLEGVVREATARLRGRCVLHPAVPHDAAPALFRLMDVFVLPSRATPQWREQFGRVLVEAAASGLPIVAAATGEIPHVIHALGGGLLVAERDPAVLAAALRHFLVDAAARQDAAKANLAAAHRDFSQEAVAARMAGLLLGERTD